MPFECLANITKLKSHQNFWPLRDSFARRSPGRGQGFLWTDPCACPDAPNGTREFGGMARRVKTPGEIGNGQRGCSVTQKDREPHVFSFRFMRPVSSILASVKVDGVEPRPCWMAYPALLGRSFHTLQRRGTD